MSWQMIATWWELRALVSQQRMRALIRWLVKIFTSQP